VKFKSRYVHAISPRPNDYGPEIEVTESDLRDKKALGKKLLEARILSRGDRVVDYRKEPGGVVVFPGPRVGGMWHAIVLETPLHKSFAKRQYNRRVLESRLRKFLLHHGEKSYIQGERFSALRARASKYTKAKRSR